MSILSISHYLLDIVKDFINDTCGGKTVDTSAFIKISSAVISPSCDNIKFCSSIKNVYLLSMSEKEYKGKIQIPDSIKKTEAAAFSSFLWNYDGAAFLIKGILSDMFKSFLNKDSDMKIYQNMDNILKNLAYCFSAIQSITENSTNFAEKASDIMKHAGAIVKDKNEINKFASKFGTIFNKEELNKYIESPISQFIEFLEGTAKTIEKNILIENMEKIITDYGLQYNELHIEKPAPDSSYSDL